MDTANPTLSESESKNLFCLREVDRYCASSDFALDDGRVRGLAASQYLGYVLEPNPSPEPGSPERMILHYATADVVILGRQLKRIAGALSRGGLERLQPLSARYAGVTNLSPFIVSIQFHLKENP